MKIDWNPEIKQRGEAAATKSESTTPDPVPEVDPEKMPREQYLFASVMDVLSNMPGIQRMIKDPTKQALGGLVRCCYEEFTTEERRAAIAAIPAISRARENGWSRMVGVSSGEAQRRADRACRLGEESRDRLMHIERDDPNFLARAACAEFHGDRPVDLDAQELDLWHRVVRRIVYELTGIEEVKL